MKNKGFALIEFMIILAIIFLLIAIIYPAFKRNSSHIVVIDGCEYITEYQGYHTLTHKGNCTNYIHFKK